MLLTLAVPLGLVVAPRTRRFGLYMLIGMVATALVVLGVAALVLWSWSTVTQSAERISRPDGPDGMIGV